jgi:hypothetical protein
VLVNSFSQLQKSAMLRVREKVLGAVLVEGGGSWAGLFEVDDDFDGGFEEG